MSHDPRAGLHGPALTPWNPARWAGGSSGGSGAAVAAGAVPFALGSETAGSIASPAAWCGVTGFRPSFGRVSRAGVAPLAPTLDKVGVLARSATDCATVLQAVSGRDRLDPTVTRGRVDAPSVVAVEVGALRVGLAESDVEHAAPEPLRPSLRDAVAAVRELGVQTVDACLPEAFDYRGTLDTIVGAEGAASFQPLVAAGRLDLVGDASARQAIAEAPVRAVDYLAALEARTRLDGMLEELFAACDLVLTTNFALPWPIPAVDEEWDAIPILGGSTAAVWAGNLAGLPAAFLPVAPVDGLPVGIQVFGPPGADARVLAFAVAFQAVTSWHRQRPATMAAT
jgi:aspartyl-tRNA(Asn)/glutamyl-tRNA(Gln) amidotransferase subunit A